MIHWKAAAELLYIQTDPKPVANLSYWAASKDSGEVIFRARYPRDGFGLVVIKEFIGPL